MPALTTLFDRLYRRLRRPSLRYAYTLVGSHDLAEDVVQDVFLKLSSNQQSGAAPSPQYIRAMVRNKAIDRLRRNLRERRYLQGDGAAAASRIEQDTPETRLLQREAQRQAHAALLALPDIWRKVFILRKFNDMSYEAIAAELKISQSTAIRYMRQAITQLALALEEEPVDMTAKKDMR